jgi:DNA-binding GntR family transcriptional regulator
VTPALGASVFRSALLVTAVEQTLPLKCDRGLRRRLIVQAILTDVFQGRLRAGQHLVTQGLADRFGVSHTPIREALVALAGMGIIDLEPNRGAVVRRVTARDVQEFCQVRRALESEATRGACGRIAPAELDALALEFRTLEGAPTGGADEGRQRIVRAGAADDRLHDLIAASCGNGFLVKELNRLKILSRAFREVSYNRDEAPFISGRLADELREHLAIVEALRAEQRKAAGQAMGRHILSAVKHWTRTLTTDSIGTGLETPSPPGVGASSPPELV